MGVNMNFETQRLQIAPWQEIHPKPELTNLLTPKVLRFLPDNFAFHGDSEQWIKDRLQESEVYAIFEIKSHALVGLMILNETDETPPTIYVGTLFAEKYWGQGYAGELLRGSIEALRMQKRHLRLMAGAEKENIASARALLRYGFERVEELSSETADMFVLELAQSK